ncbi:MAG: glycosyl hydrolase family 17 protein [Planctomycetota bacterium]
MTKPSLFVVLFAFGTISPSLQSIGEEPKESAAQAQNDPTHQIQRREFSPYCEGEWIGQGISYGPYRAGQSPGGMMPNRAEMTEDLRLLLPHWKLLRVYGSGPETEEILKIIREEKLPMQVMVGAWIAGETASDNLAESVAVAGKRANHTQVADVIRLANAYPDQVIAISVGNESRVYWSDHMTRQEVLIDYIRQVREATAVPVTTADDFNFWNKSESKEVAAEIDFIVTHIHAHWAGNAISTAMPWTREIYSELSTLHPDKAIVIGEAGWATKMHSEGAQAEQIKGEASEKAQLRYYREFTDWASEEQICTFFFEAFDESWKGGPHPNEVEKHWGLFFEDRTPKAALRTTR